MSKIAAAIITLNEERNIERCLKALVNCVDEIVVLDSFSSDRTAEICAKYKVRFIQKEWQGYAQSKNELNSLIEADYIFSVDADEAPDQELIAAIIELKTKGLNGIYEINRKTNYCGKWILHCGWYPEHKMRIFPKNSGRWVGDFVHETLEYSQTLKVHRLKGHLEHYSYYTSEEHRRKAFQYADLSVQKYLKENKKPYPFQAMLSAFVKFISIFIINKGFMDGFSGFQIAKISAAANRYKYKTLKKQRIK